MSGHNRAPGGGGRAGFYPQRHEPMIGGVEFDFIDSLSIAIECLELRRIFVRLRGPRGGLGRTGSGAKSRKPFCVRLSTRGRDSSLKRLVGREQVHVLEWRWLVGDLVRSEPVAWT